MTTGKTLRGASGEVHISTGSSYTSRNSDNIKIENSNNNVGPGGRLIIKTGSGLTSGGDITIEGGTGFTKKGSSIITKSRDSTSGTSNTGIVSIGPSSVSYDDVSSGRIDLTTGNATDGDSGNVLVNSSNAQAQAGNT
jgi:hypothetical protein